MNVIIVIDWFMYVNFGKIFDIASSDIVFDTNPRETSEFFATYLSPQKIVLWLVALIAANYAAWKLAGLVVKTRRLKFYISTCLCLGGLFIMGFCTVNFLLFRSGNGIPQYTSLTRVFHAVYISKTSQKSVESLIEVADKTRQKVVAGSGLPSDIVVVIGESHSVYHTSFMGYERPTYPHISNRIAEGEIVVIGDAVTIDAYTHAVMASIFSLSRQGEAFGSMPLFPMVFKSAGYYCSMYDNQYLAGDGISILGHPAISEKMFNRRNTKHYGSDEELALAIEPARGRNLIVCHLMGQHYEYAERYPHNRFSKFKPSEYTGDDYVRKAKAHYDNACLYNDYVLNRIIEHFIQRDACLIYLSDHGEEVYEDGKYAGHGNAGQRPDLKYQIHVPMFIWASEAFRKLHPDKWQAITQCGDLPVCTDDLPHILMDIAGIETDCFNPQRSFINQSFNPKIHRTVLHSIDYDAAR